MAKALHIVKRADGRWEVKRQGAKRAASAHPSQAEAVAAGRRLALKSGGAEVVTHRADGKIRDSESVGAARIDDAKQGRVSRERPAGARGRSPSTSRAPRSEGPRTTLRLPNALADIADRLAADLEVSRNDALLRLATRGARLYEQEQAIAERRDERWAAVVPGFVDVDQVEFPSSDEARNAVLEARDERAGEPAG